MGLSTIQQPASYSGGRLEADTLTSAGSRCDRSYCDSSAETWGGTSPGTPAAGR